MSAPPRVTTPFDSAGTSTYVLQLANGQYVYDPTCTVGGCSGCLGFDVGRAHLWIDTDGAKALAVAARTPWIGASATAKRARP